jgi:DNA-binding NtrC family response regulator
MNETRFGNGSRLSPHFCLIVDDEEPIRSYVRKVLKGVHYETLEATSVKDAQWLLEGNDVDLIISDIEMPGGDGLVFVTKISELRPAMPIIVMSGHAEDARQKYPRGVVEFLQKPFSPGSLLGAIQKATRMIELGRGCSLPE